jgi:hypothetical protein
MARPLGSQNKDKPFREALRVELAAAGEDQRALREIARNLIAQAQKNDTGALPAIKEIGDRLDGKPAQAIIGGEDDDPAIRLECIRRVIVDPNSGNSDSGGVPPATGAGPV